MKKVIFFGCGNERKGHDLHETDRSTMREMDAEQTLGLSRGAILRVLDSTFCPQKTITQGLYQVNSVPPLMIVSWWDYTGDSRRDSNSSLIGVGFDNAEELIDAGTKQFPQIMGRQPRPQPNQL